MARTWSVTEATETTAFLSDDTGEDVAVLERLPDELYDSSSPLSGEDWQAMIDLVAAAPVMLKCLRIGRDALIELYEQAYPDDESDNDITQAIDLMIDVIAKAEGRSE